MLAGSERAGETMPSEAVALETPLVETPRLRVPATLVGLGDGLHVLDVVCDSAPRVLVPRARNAVNAEVAVSHDGAFALATLDGATLFRVDRGQTVSRFLALSELRFRDSSIVAADCAQPNIRPQAQRAGTASAPSPNQRLQASQ
jgi:hypothetical protein